MLSFDSFKLFKNFLFIWGGKGGGGGGGGGFFWLFFLVLFFCKMTFTQ